MCLKICCILNIIKYNNLIPGCLVNFTSTPTPFLCKSSFLAFEVRENFNKIYYIFKFIIK